MRSSRNEAGDDLPIGLTRGRQNLAGDKFAIDDVMRDAPIIGAGEQVSALAKTLRDLDAVMVVEEGKPVGVITRYDLLGFLSDGALRK